MSEFGKLISGLGMIVSGVRTVKSVTKKRDGESGQIATTDKPMRVTMRQVNSLSDRIGYIRKMIYKGREDPRVREFAAQVLRQKCGGRWCVPEKDYRGEIVALFDAVRQRVRYTRDMAHADTYQSPARTMQMGIADCDDFTSLLAALLQSVGFPVILRVVQTRNAKSWSHIYLLAGLPPDNPTKWMPLDASVDKPAGWQAPASMIVKKRDFPV